MIDDHVLLLIIAIAFAAGMIVGFILGEHRHGN